MRHAFLGTKETTYKKTSLSWVQKHHIQKTPRQEEPAFKEGGYKWIVFGFWIYTVGIEINDDTVGIEINDDHLKAPAGIEIRLLSIDLYKD